MVMIPREKKVKSAEEVIAEHAHKHGNDDADCPTCKGKEGHKLKLSEHGTLKCSGEGCGEEFININKIKELAEGTCKTCNTPVINPLHGNAKCLKCGGKDIDW